ncbi:MAG: ABC transporter permease [Chloroflexi bacterium]|nr:ABC transporter permease [Chloroflexota bacterium]
MGRELNAALMLAQRDVTKLLRDRARLVAELVFPVIFIGILGGSLQANLGAAAGYDFVAFTFTGVLAMTLFQTTAQGIISLIEDRENDFAQEIFVSPISRYTIVGGKILGETLVATPVAVGIVAFAVVLGVPLTVERIAAIAVAGLVAAFFGGSFGLLVLSNLPNRRAAQNIFPFVMLPQYFLAGIFNPIAILPWYLDIASHISPMRYAVDLMRGLFYRGSAEYDKVVLQPPTTVFAIIAAAFVGFMVVGTALFVRKDRER